MSWLDEIVEEVRKASGGEGGENLKEEKKDAPGGQEQPPKVKRSERLDYSDAFYDAFS